MSIIRAAGRHLARHGRRVRSRWTTLVRTLHEPPDVTGIIVVYYIALAIIGLAGLVTEAPAALAIRWTSAVAWGACLIAGTLGAPTAWRGVWWLERAAAFAGIVASVSIALLMAGLCRLSPASEHDATLTVGLVAGLCSALALFTTRYRRVRQAPWAPGREPQAAREHAARTERGA